MTVQYLESDLAFLKRLLAEEGLFCWFEHALEEGETLGKHTLVIADSNQAFTANAQSRIRFTQAGATLAEDSLDQWLGQRHIDTAETNATSWDYRSLSVRAQGSASAIDSGAPKEVPLGDNLGANVPGSQNDPVDYPIPHGDFLRGTGNRKKAQNRNPPKRKRVALASG